MIDPADTQPTSDRIIVNPVNRPVCGTFIPPPDKSITHRALFFAALNNGITTIRNPSRAADPRTSFDLLRTLGYGLRDLPDRWEMHGCGALGPLGDRALDCGNSGTTARLAMGFLTGEIGRFTLVGDRSLMIRPMGRVAEPLRRLGAAIETADGAMPVRVVGDGFLQGVEDGIGVTVTSAQVHGSLVLATLRARKGLTIQRAKPMRDHTLPMARAFGARIETRRELGFWIDRVEPGTFDIDLELAVPGDFSSAAFMIAAAILIPGSEVRIENVGLNPTRTAFLDALKMMGANVAWRFTGTGPEDVGVIEAAHSPRMKGIVLSGEKNDFPPVAEMMDELPLLALLATRAQGITEVHGAMELRVKETDRIASTASVLRSLGLEIIELDDGFAVEGRQRIWGGGSIDHHGDHRLCMLAAVAALAAERPVTIAAPEAASISYPEFWNDLARLAGTER